MEDDLYKAQEATDVAPQLRWYAFKVFFNKVFEMDKAMRERGAETFFPTVRVERTIAGKTRNVVKPAISSLLFVRCSEEMVLSFQQTFTGRVMMYSHVTNGVRRPSPIDDEEMRIFKLATSVNDDRLQYLDVGSVNYKKGQKVRVIDGPYKGCLGYIKRVKGNRRLLVSVEGIALVATSYIPSEFLEKI